MRTLLLSNVNMQPLVAFLKPWNVVCGEFNSILLELSNPGSRAASAEFEQILCLFDTDSLLGGAFYGEGEPEQSSEFLLALEDFCAKHPGKTVIANTFCCSTDRCLSFADLLNPQSLQELESSLNQQLVRVAKLHPNLLLIDIRILVQRLGEEAALSTAFWYLGRIRFTNLMFRALAEYILTARGAYENRSRKVLALDLDNTLWGGIVGETGPLGIALSEDGVGRCYRDFQRAVKSLKKVGVLLAICSKNNPEDVEEVFERNHMMALKRDDFVSIRVNWGTKPENLESIADELNLGVDSIVFIDDNPVERDMVQSALPGVAVPAFPSRPENLLHWFVREVIPIWFGKYAITTEDTRKSEQYSANAKRRKLSTALDFDGFLSSLKIECTIWVDPHEQVKRVAQMTQKTNQFNLTSRRYDIAAIQEFLNSSTHSILVLEYKDRFGAEGAVGLAILDYSQSRIDTFLLSCRVIGRRVEQRLLSRADELFRARGCTKIVGEYIPSSKNQQVADFYETNGFVLKGQKEDGQCIYERQLI